jgi:L-lactate utilization protein LutC
VGDREAAAKIVELVRARSARRVLLGRGRVLDSLPLADALREAGVEVTRVDELPPGDPRGPLFAAEVGISEPDYLIAETGSLAVAARPNEPRSLTLLPPVHIAVADPAQLVPDLFDLFTKYPSGLPSSLVLITGPSKTGDIELRLVTGVHGPGEVHVVLLAR